MDLNDLFHSHGVSLLMAQHAACDRSRSAGAHEAAKDAIHGGARDLCAHSDFVTRRWALLEKRLVSARLVETEPQRRERRHDAVLETKVVQCDRICRERATVRLSIVSDK